MIFMALNMEIVMDDELFDVVYQIAWTLWPRREKRVTYPGRTIVLMYLWSVLRCKPRQWVCDRRNLPARLQDVPIPSRSQFGRRLNSADIQAMLVELEQQVNQTAEVQGALVGCWLVDAKPLVVSPYSKDKEARWGWAYNGMARGYKLYALSDLDQRIVAWRVYGMNQAEPTVAPELLDQIDRPGYVIGDSIYDSGPLHEVAAQRDLQLIAPRKDPTGNIGRRARQPTRLRSIDMLETFVNRFGPSMYDKRTEIERAFSRIGASRIGLDHLPPFVRTLRRVEPWIRAKLTLYAVMKQKELRH